MTKSGKTPPDSEPTTKNTSLDQLDNSDEAVLAEVSVSYSGPLPPPEILTKFDKAVPGLAKRIADDAKKEQQFSHEVNRKVLESNEANAVSARWLPYVSNIFLTIIAIYGIYSGFELVAVVAVAAIGSQKLPAIISALKKNRE